MYSKKIKIIFLLALSIAWPTAKAEIANNNKRLPLAEIDAEISRLFYSSPTSAMSVTIFSDREILYSKGFGHADREKKQSIDPKLSQFRIDSISKAFTTAAVVNLIERDLINVESSILDLDQVRFVQFLKSYETAERLQKWKQIKIKHLLTHQAGISKDLPGARVFWNSSALKDHAYPGFDQLYQGLLKTEFLYPAGQTEGAFKYSNLGMNLLARVVEDLNPEKLTFVQFVSEFVFKPNGMMNSSYNFSSKSLANRVTGYGTSQLDGRPLEIPHVFSVGSYDGSIGVAASTEDLSRFGQQIILATHSKKNKLFSSHKTAYDFFTLPSDNIFMTKGRAQAHGFFWRFRPVQETDIKNLWVGNTGFGYGFESLLLVNPAHRIGVAIIVNSSESTNPSFSAWEVVVNKLNALKQRPVSQRTQKLLTDVREKLIKSEGQVRFNQTPGQNATPQQLQKFAGKYFADNSIAGPIKDFIIKQNDEGKSHLYFVLNPDVHFQLVAEDIDRGQFRFPKVADLLFNYEKVEFTFDSNGNVKSVILAQVKELEKIAE